MLSRYGTIKVILPYVVLILTFAFIYWARLKGLIGLFLGMLYIIHLFRHRSLAFQILVGSNPFADEYREQIYKPKVQYDEFSKQK